MNYQKIALYRNSKTILNVILLEFVSAGVNKTILHKAGVNKMILYKADVIKAILHWWLIASVSWSPFTFAVGNKRTVASLLFPVSEIIQKVRKSMSPAYRPVLPSSEITSRYVKSLIDLVRSCWAEIPAFRPNFTSILTSLKKMHDGK